MSAKRSRKEFEADLQAQQSPYVLYGTPLPPLDPEVRDDGSFVPIWKQQVTDEQGRRRLHGAFTGGFSAGYFNTVGSKEGWTPSTFTSSRSSKRKDAEPRAQQRAEDFMDDEDLADAAESQKLQTNQKFSGFGSTANDPSRQGIMMGLLRPSGDTMGVTLLQKMGWKKGQGIGPRVARAVRTDQDSQAGEEPAETHLFAPDDVPIIDFVHKTDRHGLGYESEPRLSSVWNGNEADENQPDPFPTQKPDSKPQLAKPRTGIGVGVTNDTGSDDEDPYEIGPRISYNRTIGGDKKKKPKKKPNNVLTANPLLSSRPIFTPKQLQSSSTTVRKCHDGRLPLDGFVLAQTFETLSLDPTGYTIPKIPADWKSAISNADNDTDASAYQSTADAAKESTLNHKSRAALLGEAQLPGKSVFDFLSPAARERLVSASGKTNLPQARGEALPTVQLDGKSTTEELAQASPELDMPYLERKTAAAALGRGIGGWMPYADNEVKRSRYRGFLEYQAGITQEVPKIPPDMDTSTWKQELHEFVRAAQVFKPMTGAMASRFTTASATSSLPADTGKKDQASLLSTPVVDKGVADPAEEAARAGMFGPLTRTINAFYPTRLLCKRFNVKPPINVQPDGAATSAAPPTSQSSSYTTPVASNLLLEAPQSAAQPRASESGDQQASQPSKTEILTTMTGMPPPLVIDAERNEALEGQRAGEALFKAIFGSDDEDDD